MSDSTTKSDLTPGWLTVKFDLDYPLQGNSNQKIRNQLKTKIKSFCANRIDSRSQICNTISAYRDLKFTGDYSSTFELAFLDKFELNKLLSYLKEYSEKGKKPPLQWAMFVTLTGEIRTQGTWMFSFLKMSGDSKPHLRLCTNYSPFPPLDVETAEQQEHRIQQQQRRALEIQRIGGHLQEVQGLPVLPVLVAAQEPPAPVAAQEPPAPVAAQEPPAPVAAQEPPAPVAAEDLAADFMLLNIGEPPVEYPDFRNLTVDDLRSSDSFYEILFGCAQLRPQIPQAD